MSVPGQDPGHPGWEAVIDGLVGQHGSLAAVAAHLAAQRGFTEDIESVARGLRRLRRRGSQPGGTWGERVLRTYGLPRDVSARLRFMGSYHSRFVDLPVPLCLDLVQLWDRPPASEAPGGRRWLSLARACVALRQRDWDAASRHLETADAAGGGPAARAETALGRALLEARASRDAVPVVLDGVPALLAEVGEPGESQCLRARYVGQVAHAHNRTGRIEAAEALHAALPDGPEVHPFARSRRANGLAYARWRQGDVEAARMLARSAATFAGDAGHVRLRAMALLMLARVARGTAEATEARRRAGWIAEALDDEVLRVRVRRSAAQG